MKKRATWIAAVGAAGLLTQLANPAGAAQTSPARHYRAQDAPLSVTVTGVAANVDSVKIDYQPVSGARDYRVFDLGAPTKVKYAGLAHLDLGNSYCTCHFVLQPDGATPAYPIRTEANASGQSGPTHLDIPATELEWNGIGDGHPHTLVVQALDALGPAPRGSLYDGNLTPQDPSAASSGAMLGANAGPTSDGLVSINGQGSAASAPRVIAQSPPFVVAANASAPPLPSRSDANQTFLDTFGNDEAGSFQRVGSVDPSNGVMTYTLGLGTSRAWTIQYQNADTRDSMPMIKDDHFMDMLFDGGTPGTSVPLHVSHGLMAMSPQATADFSAGRLLHLTMEVDAHESGRRWVAFNLAPADDPLTNWYTSSGTVNTSNTALFAQIFPQKVATDLFNGKDVAITGAAGQAPIWSNRTLHWGGNGLALDNRSRFDLFATRKHFAVFEDGQLSTQGDIPGGLPFDKAKVYFAHYLYHTANDLNELTTYAPYETYWTGTFPYSDERHWDNMGFEVLPAAAVPASSDWSSLSGLVHMPQSAAPVPADPNTVVPPVGSAVPTTATVVSTPTAIAATTPPAAVTTSTATTAPTSTATTAPSATAVGVATPPTVPSVTATTPTTPTTKGLPSGRYTVETRIIDAQGRVRLVTTAPLVIP